jgi:hypothetical protein
MTRSRSSAFPLVNQKNCLQEFCYAKGHAIDHYEQRPDHCVFFDKAKCALYCHQCDLEITDVPSEGSAEDSKALLFSFRRIFFPKLEIARADSPFPNYLFEQCNFPLHFLEQSIAMIYSNNFLRKTLKRVHKSHRWVKERFQKKLFPRTVRLLVKLVFNFNKKSDMTTAFKKFYFCVISKDNRLAKYSQNNFGVD